MVHEIEEATPADRIFHDVPPKVIVPGVSSAPDSTPRD